MKTPTRGCSPRWPRRACVVVTDEFPAFFLPRMVTAAARRLDVRVELVDSNGLLPLRATDRMFPSAYQFRRFLQRELPRHLAAKPKASPVKRARAAAAEKVAGGGSPALAAGGARAFAEQAGAGKAADRSWRRSRGVLRRRRSGRQDAQAVSRPTSVSLSRRAERAAGRRHQRLSPYLHFGHIAVHEVFDKLMNRESWSPARLAAKATGNREGWWGAGPAAEAFLDELITWRELGFNMCAHDDRLRPLRVAARVGPHDAGESMPTTGASHVYTLAQLRAGADPRPAVERRPAQLVREGRMHNYLRMLWGKKILEWTPSPREAWP